jgi:hypothetical protein
MPALGKDAAKLGTKAAALLEKNNMAGRIIEARIELMQLATLCCSDINGCTTAESLLSCVELLL